MTPLDRFYSYTKWQGECLVWVGGVNNKGYGRFRDGEQTVGAHRWIYQHVNGPLPKSTYVRHTCDNPPCVNLTHLLSGTPSDNRRDMVERDRTPEHMRKQDRCSQGHSDWQVYPGSGHRRCRTCRLDRERVSA